MHPRRCAMGRRKICLREYQLESIYRRPCRAISIFRRQVQGRAHRLGGLWRCKELRRALRRRQAGGGYARRDDAVANRKSETLWCSPACVQLTAPNDGALFSEVANA